MTIEEITQPYTGSLSRSVGKQIRLIRKMKGLTLNDIARKCSTTAQTIQRLEVGSITISVDWIETIAGALEMEPFEFFPYPRHTVDQLKDMRAEVEVLKIRAIDFLSHVDKFLKETESSV